MTSQEEKFLTYIQKFDKDNRVFSPQIERDLEIDGIEVRNISRDLRRQGFPIASGYGYWYDEEDPNILDHLEGRAISELETVRLFRENRSRALHKNPQMEMAL